MAVLLLAICLFKSAYGGDKTDIGPSFKNWKNFVLQGFISDLENQPTDLFKLGDLAHVAQSYEQFGQACEEIKAINAHLAKIYRDQEFAVCSHVILGAGDTGTTVWLGKYKPFHGKIHEKLNAGQLPDVLMIGETLGSWRHDYTLAQPYSLLERVCNASSPSDYLFQQYHSKNPYANARHVFQANLVNLAKTEAPHLANIRVVRIERKSDHLDDWQSLDHDYRIVTRTLPEEKFIYSSEIDICSGLGPAREAISEKCTSDAEFEVLTQFNDQKAFTPIIDGDHFILTGSEEICPESRTIVVYGGGGTAAACYRKGYFGHDRQKDFNSFENQPNKNKVIWIAKEGFDAAGGGRLATKALETAKKRNELFIAELDEISCCSESGKLKLCFAPAVKAAELGSEGSISEIECDQLVYAIGQDAIDIKQICKEFDSDLQLEVNQDGMPLSVKTKDEKVHFFGAAAMAMRQRDYMSNTWGWLHQENIGPDVGPGSMPPSRAQIKKHISELGIDIECVNVNMDSSYLIHTFLVQSGIEKEKVVLFIDDILQARKDSTAGFTAVKLQALLDKYDINGNVRILGLSHLVKKK